MSTTPSVKTAPPDEVLAGQATAKQNGSQRLLSLDLFRGATMFFLIGGSTRLYSHFNTYTVDDTFAGSLARQFTHHTWNGLYFWDLIQPFFMFIVGVAMVYSLNKRIQLSTSWADINRHMIRRCLILFFLGVLLHCIYRGEIVWELWNVLTQLGVTIMIAYLIFNYRLRTQFAISFGLLLAMEILYRSFAVDGFDQPFVRGANFGSWMDMVLMGKTSPGGWVAINAIPTAAHTIWGVIAGKILSSAKVPTDKIRILAIAGVVGLLVGYGLDWSGITPIIKRISTSSFVIVSGGWCLLVLAACYWLVDVKGYKRIVFFFSVVGMNSIFIYMFTETVGRQWLPGFLSIFTTGLLQPLGAGEAAIQITTSIALWAAGWYLCYWLYQRKVFIKI